MTNNQKLAHALMLKFGLAPHEPTIFQLEKIKTTINELNAEQRFFSDSDWAKVVAHYCPSFGQYAYKGIDNSDLNSLLALALQTARG